MLTEQPDQNASYMSIEHVRPGDILKEPVIFQGNTFYTAGRALSNDDIMELKILGIGNISIRRSNNLDGDVFQDNPLSKELRIQALETARLLYQDFKNLDPRFGHHIHELTTLLNTEIRKETPFGVALNDLRAHNVGVFHHCINVTSISLAIGIHMDLDPEQLNNLTIGGLLHDIGCINIPNELLNKSTPLTKNDWNIIHRHPFLGWQMVKDQTDFNPVVQDIVRHHHETLDGGGYPDKLSKDKIHPLARIVTIVDIWDKLRTELPFKEAWSPDRILNFLDGPEMAGKLDQDVMNVINKLILPYPIGSRVMITGGRIGNVVGINLADYYRPIIRLDEGGALYDMLGQRGIRVIKTLGFSTKPIE